MLEIEIRDRPGCMIVRPVGEIDSFTVSTLRDWFAAVSYAPRLVIDLSGVPFIDSAGVGALVGGVRRVRERGGDVAVALGRSSVTRALQTIRLDQLVPMADTIDEAAAGLLSDHDRAVSTPGS